MSYSFRLRFRISDKINLGFEDRTVSIWDSDSIKINLHAHQPETNIKDSSNLVLKGYGYNTPEEAEIAGENARDILTLAFSKLRFPADFGDRIAKGFWTEYGLKMLGEQSGGKILNDMHGLQVFKTDMEPKFAMINVKAVITKSKDNVLDVLRVAFSKRSSINERKRLAFELFSASAFSTYVDARFMLLMMALEVLIDQNKRIAEEQEVIDKLIDEVNKSNIRTKNSILGGIESLRLESIGSAGKRLAAQLKNQYLEMSPPKFFTFCYELRSKLVHGHIPRPTFEELGNVIAALENFTTDLICFPEL